MEAVISSWGNSLGLRIPKVFAQMAGLSKNQTIDLSVEHGVLHITPKKTKKSLDQLISQIPDGYTPNEFWKDSPALGKEVW